MDAIKILTDDDEQTIHPAVTNENDESQNQTTESFEMAIYNDLVDICQSNIRYFEGNNNTVTIQRFLNAFRKIIQRIEIVRQYVTEFHGFMHEYDFDENTPANGYRGIVKVTHEYIKHTTKVSKHIAENRGNFLFRKQRYVKEIETCSQALASLCSIFIGAKKIREQCDNGLLIPTGEHKAVALFNMAGSIDQYPFYGRCIGIHYCSTIQSAMKRLGNFFTGFSELYYSSDGIVKTTTSIYNGSKYHQNPELRAKRFLDLSLHASIHFNKTFFSLTEKNLIHIPANLLNAKIKVNRLMTIPPVPLEIENTQNSNEMVQIPIPSSHLGAGPVTVRLLSNVRRAGMQSIRNNHHIHPMSNSLVFHCHGGGFIAHTSKSHEIYLRRWAAELRVPIVSIDYSLAPQAPYPRALEEIFYAYCWAIKNAHLLGTTAERIVVVGDSAGGYLVMALMLKCIEQSVRRPDGALLIYCPLILGFDPSPSRLLTVMDVILPFGFSMKCLISYFNPGEEQLLETNEKKKARCKESVLSTDRNLSEECCFDIQRDHFKSPLYANDEMLKQLPPIKFVSADIDPFIDDSVMAAKRLKALGIPVGLDVLSGTPHGFLIFVHLSKEAHAGSRICIARLAELLGTTLDTNR